MTDPTSEILLSSLDDWVSLEEARSLVQESLPTTASTPEVRSRTLAVVDDLVRRGLMEAGELSPRFVAWDGTPDEISRRIAEGWSGDDDLWLGSICWLANTPSGAALAESLSDR